MPCDQDTVLGNVVVCPCGDMFRLILSLEAEACEQGDDRGNDAVDAGLCLTCRFGPPGSFLRFLLFADRIMVLVDRLTVFIVLQLRLAQIDTLLESLVVVVITQVVVYYVISDLFSGICGKCFITDRSVSFEDIE